MPDKMDSIKEERFEVTQVHSALELAKGNVSMAARSLRTSRSTLYEYLKRYPELKTVLTDARESMIDNAESALHAAALKGEGWAVCFTLKTIGRSRGYIEKHEISVTDEREFARDAWARYRAANPDKPTDEALERCALLVPEVATYKEELARGTDSQLTN